jgi:hypothetical protein
LCVYRKARYPQPEPHSPAVCEEVQLSLKLQIELVYDPDCPNVDRARDILATACRGADVPAVWSEWNSEDAECPAHARNLGSPTILVNGEDVAPGPHPWAPREPGAGPRCRVYRDGDAIVPAPPLSRVEAAIGTALQPEVG